MHHIKPAGAWMKFATFSEFQNIDIALHIISSNFFVHNVYGCTNWAVSGYVVHMTIGDLTKSKVFKFVYARRLVGQG